MSTKEEFIRKVLEIGCDVSNTDTIIFYSDGEMDDEVYPILMRLKEEYGIKNFFTYIRSDKEIYEFLKTNPSESDMRNFIDKKIRIKNRRRAKILFNYTTDYENYIDKIKCEFADSYNLLVNLDMELNSEFWDLYEEENRVVITCFPSFLWAEHLLGSKDKLDELWELVNRTALTSRDNRIYLSRIKELRSYLNKTKIKNLRFYSSLGTDFQIGLLDCCHWVSVPEIINGKEYYPNFPSYELFTSPDCYSTEGRIVLSRPLTFFGNSVQKGDFLFKKGKCIKAQTDCEYLERLIRNRKNGLDRIGEIALVTCDSPIACLNRNFDALLYDENAGCHFALGDAVIDAINIKDLPEESYKQFNLNHSTWHYDFVFGDPTTQVEGTRSDGKKLLILENGKWKI